MRAGGEGPSRLQPANAKTITAMPIARPISANGCLSRLNCRCPSWRFSSSQAEADFDPIPFDAAGARAFGIVASAYRQSGRKRAARAFDALIAATAIAHGLPLYTANPADFAGIDRLVVRTVRMPDTGT